MLIWYTNREAACSSPQEQWIHLQLEEECLAVSSLRRPNVVRDVKRFTRSGFGPKRQLTPEKRKALAGKLRKFRKAPGLHGKKFSVYGGLPLSTPQKQALRGK